MRTKIKELTASFIGKTVTILGWVKTLRDQKSFAFLEINDGSSLANLQIILDSSLDYKKLATGCSLSVTGTIQKSPAKGQDIELKATSFTLIGYADPETYPLQKKNHTFEFLRTIAHLRPRTNTQGAIARVRNTLVFAVHRFFQERGFLFMPAPIITGADCEGAGALFQVTTLPEEPPRTKEGTIDYSKDFFGKKAYLTVSGQLEAETYASALGDVYTFGPTFRAENSHTSRHLAEFWMIEPEMAFATLEDDMELAESFLKFLIGEVFKNSSSDLNFFDHYIEKGLIERLKHVLETPFAKMTYTEAIDILQKTKKTFEYPVKWGIDLQSEHERYLTEDYCQKPLILTDYPKAIKAFYMRHNEDGKTVSAMDVLVPKIGEIIGGSQREERLDVLERKIDEMDLDKQNYWWYLDLRRYGSVPHAGFGLGFERLIQFVTGMENIRDVIPFPRVPGFVEF